MRSSVSTLVALSTATVAAAAGLAAPPRGKTPPPCAARLPPELAVPAGNELAFSLAADGVQIYACGPGAEAPSWTLRAPEARLYAKSGHAAGTHSAGPTWESSDGSKVVGAKVAGVTVDTDAIPWLLLRADSHAGSGRMDGVTFVQRVRTEGGVPPAGGCDAAHAGAVAQVPYRAVYCFFRKTGESPAN